MANTPRMSWPFPNENQSPWYQSLENFAHSVDASGFASREDRHLVLIGGGTIEWLAPGAVLSWSAPIQVVSPISGFLLSVDAASVTLDDGQVLYATLVRAPTYGQGIPVSVGNQVPQTDTALLLAVRVGDRVYWRNGLALESGDSISGLGIRVVASSAENYYGPAVIVGNSLRGDTSAGCHFLDTGNCAGLAAAIAAAGVAGVDVYVRPGDYDFGAGGAPASRISVPANVRVRGAGRRNTRILTRAAGGDGRAFTLGTGASLEDLQIYCPTPTANQVGGYEIIEAPSDDNSLIRVDVKFEGNWATIGDATWAAVNSAIGCYGARPNLIDCKIIDGPQLYDMPWGNYFYGVFCYAVEHGTFRNVYTTGLDQAFYYEYGRRSDISDLKLIDFRHYGAVLIDSMWDNVRGGHLRSDGASWGAWGLSLAYADFENVCDVACENGGVNATAFWFEYTSNSKLDGCRGDGSWGDYFLRLSSSSNYNVIVANQFGGDTIGDSGSNNDFGHNQA